jgi:hypothetical protein
MTEDGGTGFLLDVFVILWDERLLRRHTRTNTITEMRISSAATDTPTVTPTIVLLLVLFFVSPVRPDSICVGGMEAVEVWSNIQRFLAFC